ncbi:MAG: HEAT repeat domain-containing protein [Elusimicrobiota bacterium]
MIFLFNIGIAVSTSIFKKVILNAFKLVLIGLFILLIANKNVKGENRQQELSSTARVLIGKLFSANSQERINAAIRLSDYSHPRVVEALISCIQSTSDKMLKIVGLRSLGKIGSKESLSVILQSMSSKHTKIKIEAMRAGVNFSTPTVKQAIIKEANSKNPLIRQKAVYYLGKLNGEDSEDLIDIFIEKLNDVNEGVRAAACEELGERKVKKAVPHLRDVLLSDRAEVVREFAAQALGKIESNDSKESLKKALGDSAPTVRIKAAKSLALLGSDAGLDEAVKGFNSLNPEVRIISCEIIGMVGDDEAEIFLKRAVNDFDRRVQKAAEKALRNLRKKE